VDSNFENIKENIPAYNSRLHEDILNFEKDFSNFQNLSWISSNPNNHPIIQDLLNKMDDPEEKRRFLLLCENISSFLLNTDYAKTNLERGIVYSLFRENLQEILQPVIQNSSEF